MACVFIVSSPPSRGFSLCFNQKLSLQDNCQSLSLFVGEDTERLVVNVNHPSLNVEELISKRKKIAQNSEINFSAVVRLHRSKILAFCPLPSNFPHTSDLKPTWHPVIPQHKIPQWLPFVVSCMMIWPHLLVLLLLYPFLPTSGFTGFFSDTRKYQAFSLRIFPPLIFVFTIST